MENLRLIGLAFAFLGCLAFLFMEKQGNSFFAWLTLTVSAFVSLNSTIVMRGNPHLLFFLSTLGFVMTIVSMNREQFLWRNFEKFNLSLMCIGLYSAFYERPEITIWISSISIFMVGVPYFFYLGRLILVDKITQTVNGLFFVSSIFLLIATIGTGENPTFPLIFILYWIFASALSLKKKLRVVH